MVKKISALTRLVKEVLLKNRVFFCQLLVVKHVLYLAETDGGVTCLMLL